MSETEIEWLMMTPDDMAEIKMMHKDDVQNDKRGNVVKEKC